MSTVTTVNVTNVKEDKKMDYEIIIMRKITKRFNISFTMAAQIVKEYGARNACSHAPIVIPTMAEENAAWDWYHSAAGNAAIEAARTVIRADEAAIAAKKAEREAEAKRIASGGDRNWSRMFSIINAFVDKAKAEAVKATNAGLAAFKAIANGFEVDALKGESVKAGGQGATHMSAIEQLNDETAVLEKRKENIMFNFDLQLFAAGVCDEAVVTWLIEELEDFDYEVPELKMAPGRDDISVISPYERQISSLEEFLNIDMLDSMFNMPSALSTDEIGASADFNFNFDLQLFAAGKELIMNKHINNKRVIDALKSHEGNGLAYCLRALPMGKMSFKVVLDTTMAEINPLTRHYLAQGIAFQNLAKREIISKRGFSGYCILDVSAMAESMNRNHRQLAVAMMGAELFIGRDPMANKIVVVWNNCGTYQIISDGVNGAGNFRTIKAGVIFDDAGNVRGDWTRFKTHKNFGASKGRKHLMDMFTEEGDFSHQLDEATYGESSKSFDGEDVTAKELADKLTRLGAKGTRMGSMDTTVRNFLIAIKKFDEADGAGLNSASIIAEQVVAATGCDHTAKLEDECEGYLIQERPVTVKGAGLVVSERFMSAKAKLHNIYKIDVNNMSHEDEKIVDMILDKVAGHRSKAKLAEIKATKLAGYDAIGLISDANRGWDIYGDLNFFKDSWDYSRKSGINVLNVAHFDGDFMSANTSGQMIKIVMRAIADNQDAAFRSEADVIIKSIIDRNVDEATSMVAHPQNFDGATELDISYDAGVFTMLNPSTYVKNLDVLRNVINDKINASSNMINYDRYSVPGHSAMITVGADFWLTQKSVLSVYKDNDGRDVVEVYDPVANRYFEENNISNDNGIAVKYPAMGTREFLVLKYISEGEYIARVSAAAYSDEHKKLIIDAIKNFKEGGMMIPTNLNIVAWFAAGSDLDGDKVTALFATADNKDLVNLITKSGLKPRAVVIKAHESGSGMKAKMSEEAFAKLASWQMLGGNKSVGIVTNTFRVFTEGLQNDLSDPEVLDFYKNLLVALGATVGKKDYKSVIVKDTECGVTVFKTSGDAIEKFLAAIKDINLDEKNIRNILEDMDVLGRHCQELTIDAQKKFYEVMCKWMDNVRNFSILSLRYGIDIRNNTERNGHANIIFAGNDGYLVDGNNISINGRVVTVQGDNNTSYVLADVFSSYRVYAANAVMQKLEKIAYAYNLRVDEYASNTPERQMAVAMMASRTNLMALHQIDNICRYTYSVGTMRKDSENALRKELSRECAEFAGKLHTKLEGDIRKSINAQYKAIIDDINNELRTCYQAWGISVEDIIMYLDNEYDNAIANKLLKEERFIVMANKSDTPNFEKKIGKYIGECLMNNGMNTVTVWDGRIMMFSIYGDDPIVNLLDGEYDVIVRDGEYYLSRPYSEFVTIPEVNGNIRTLSQRVLSAEDAERLDAALNAGEKYSIVERKNRNGNKFFLINSSGEDIVEMSFGSNKVLDGMRIKENRLLSKRYAGFTGRLVNKIVNVSATPSSNGKTYYNYVISLEA